MSRKRLAVDRSSESDQDRRTPPELLDVIEARFGKFVFDLAAKKGHSIRGLPCYTPEQDALKWGWGANLPAGNRWLNPPFSRFPEFTKKAAESATPSCPIVMLTLTSIGTNWYWKNVVPFAFSYSIPRVQFIGEPYVFTKDLLVNLYGFGSGGGLIQRWPMKLKWPKGSGDARR